MVKNPLKTERWSPWTVGIGIGVLSWVTFLWMDKALGTSTTLVRAIGLLEGIFSESHVRANPYFAKYLVGKPGIEWQFVLVAMMPVGAYLAARLGGSTRVERVPALWADRFGPSFRRRAVGAFVGGVLLLFGARLAGGCTSGHAISGGMQLAVSSWVFLGAMFVSGVATAKFIYEKGGR
ncbi:MAG TPA: hypothetical protein ENK43_13595 [Planctomycetes bacterium]|nr:hypothetical protein [Planctomycetota bacterium]